MTAIELMPVADFPGRRNWGYDGVDLFAPARCYGTPDDLRRWSTRPTGWGWLSCSTSSTTISAPTATTWPGSPLLLLEPAQDPVGACRQPRWSRKASMVRAFFLENALHWLQEYHIDGLRLDATHRFFDDGPRHFLAELAAVVRESIADRPIHLIAEDPRNLAAMVRAESEGGWGLDGIWSDDFHHELRRYLVGDSDGAFRDFRGSSGRPGADASIGAGSSAASIRSTEVTVRGTDPTGLEPRQLHLLHPESRPDRQPGAGRAAQPSD